MTEPRGLHHPERKGAPHLLTAHLRETSCRHSRNPCHIDDMFLQPVDSPVVRHCTCPTPNGRCVKWHATGFGTGGVFCLCGSEELQIHMTKATGIRREPPWLLVSVPAALFPFSITNPSMASDNGACQAVSNGA